MERAELPDTEYFATFQLRAKGGVQIILHFGARRAAFASVIRQWIEHV